ncbi:response regulator transcription factor [Metabacillus arenae]|uniref:Response regulator n=1 Tax=Metabacillus arenae TaxID=2771434 RepID=A0A926RYZ4_9BACI|nr:response regulator [Metabacillus arenae]MBD1382280.1 response regulator [Metabacillus arenae]
MLSILIVDDEYLVRLGLKTTIDWKLLGLKLIGEADDGTTGLELAMQNPPDIIITDVRMPFMDGTEFMRRLRENQIDSKIVVLSGYDDFSYAKSAIDNGASAYILKPIENDKLIEVICEITDQIHKERFSQQMLKERLIADLLKALKKVSSLKTTPRREVEVAIKYIKEHYHQDVTVDTIAEEIHISQYHLMRIFKVHTGLTIHDYITEYRITKAKELLRNYHYKIYEVSGKVGYRDPRYFSQIFKKMTGTTPKQYIKQSMYE